MRTLGVVLLAAACARADDWPQWLGPTRDGVSTAKVAPWKDAPAAAWKTAVGEGHSSPVVADGRVFLHHKVKGKDEEEVAAWDAGTGAELWRQAYPRAPFKSPFGVGPRATPAVDGPRLYTHGVTGLLTCWEAATGKRLWQVDTLAAFKAPNLLFGISCSPLVHGDAVILNVGGKGASMVAFAKDTGKTLWTSMDDKASYSSPVLLDGLLVALTHDGLAGMSTSDGAPRWKFPLVDKLSESSITPVKIGGLYIASSVTYGSAGVKADGTAAWTNPVLTGYISTPVAGGDGLLYMATGTILGPPTATLRCVEPATGKILWSKAGVGQYHAALTRLGDGRLLMLDDAGNLALVEPDATAYKELARAKVCGKTWAHPALAGGRLYVRDGQELLALRLAD